MVRGKPIRYCLETEAGIAAEPGLNIGVKEEAVLVIVGVEEGDVEADDGEKFGEFEHGVDVALRREGEDEDMRRHWPLIHLTIGGLLLQNRT